jgi:DNA-binding transcriptional MerR regulator
LVAVGAYAGRMWTAMEVVRLSGVSYRRLDWWCRAGILDSVTVAAAAGTGTVRRFSAEAPAVAWILGRLTGDLGLECSQIRAAVPAVQAMVRAGRSPLRFAVEAGGVAVVDGVPAVPLEVLLDWRAGLGEAQTVLEAVAVLSDAGLVAV